MEPNRVLMTWLTCTPSARFARAAGLRRRAEIGDKAGLLMRDAREILGVAMQLSRERAVKT